MNREILFRGKRKSNERWIYGYVNADNRGVTIKFIENNFYKEIPVIPETVGQYTGLSDKNDKKIFEGDIVKTHYANANKTEFVEQVIFKGGGFRAQTKYKDNSSHSAPLYDGTPHLVIDKSVYMDSIEVIGNIHDNPELLEAAE